MGEFARVLASRVIDEIDNHLRALAQEREEAASPSLQDELDRSIHRRLRERIAWERLLSAGEASLGGDPPTVSFVPGEEHKLAS